MSDFALDQLKLAFAYHIVSEIIGADGDLRHSEQKFLASTFPPSTLETSGFVDDEGGFTARYQVAVDEALAQLPGRLEKAAKLELIEMFLDATLADEEFHHEEGNLLVTAAQLLGLTSTELDAHLSTLNEVGEVDLPEPGE